mgnify:CR=1 FL=1
MIVRRTPRYRASLDAIETYVAQDSPQAAMAEAITFIAGNDHFFLNLSMAACKV